MSTVTASTIEGRTARCTCGRTSPSTLDGSLAFFQYRGPGNGRNCDRCGYAPIVHTDPTIRTRPHMHRWEPHEWSDAKGKEFDSFYCGCRGWD